MVPDGFVFILDTNDRSFVYKSKDDPSKEERVLSLDQMHGIDQLTKATQQYTFEDKDVVLKLVGIAQNTYLGLCADREAYSNEQWDRAIDYLGAV